LERTEVGLAQSTGGLGNNNLVTILEKSDRNRVTKPGWRPDYHPEITASRKVTPSPSGKGIGLLETFTTLYATPEGFRSPLTFGFVKTESGERLLACNPDYHSPKKLKIGRPVSLTPREGLYVFEKLPFLSRLKRRLKGSHQT